MSKFFVLIVLFGVSAAQYGPSRGGYSSGGAYSQGGGGSSYSRGGGYVGGRGGGYGDESNSEPARYEFKYDVLAPEYYVEFGHQEQRDGDNTQGSYYVVLPDGRRQLVEYTADQNGYQPRISYTDGGSGAGGRGGFGGYGSGSQGGNGAGGYSGGRGGGY